MEDPPRHNCYFILISALIIQYLEELWIQYNSVLKVLKSLCLWTFVKRNVKWSKTINEMSRNIPGENFLGGNLPGGCSRGLFHGCEFWWVRIFRVGIPLEEIFLEPFSSYNVSILIFQKNIIKYNMAFNKKIYTLNS